MCCLDESTDGVEESFLPQKVEAGLTSEIIGVVEAENSLVKKTGGIDITVETVGSGRNLIMEMAECCQLCMLEGDDGVLTITNSIEFILNSFDVEVGGDTKDIRCDGAHTREDGTGEAGRG